MKGPVQFVFSVLWIGIGLSTMGNLRACTRAMTGMAAKANQSEVMSLSAWNSKLNRKAE